MPEGRESSLGLSQREEALGAERREAGLLPPCRPVCLQHFTVKINGSSTRQTEEREEKPPHRPTWAPPAGPGQGLSLGYLLLLFPGKLPVPDLHLPQTETTQCHNPSPVILPSLPPPTSDTHTLTQNDGSLDSLNEQSPGSAS